MRRIITILFVFAILPLAAQTNVSTPMSFRIVRESYPPLLSLVDRSLQLVETHANNTIEANEYCRISFRVTNRGKGPAVGCQARVRATGTTNGLRFDRSIDLPTIAVGETRTLEIPVSADMDTRDGIATFFIDFYEPNGYGIDPMSLTVKTLAFDAPDLKIVDFRASGDGLLKRKQPFDLQLLLQNTNHGLAEDVDVDIDLPSDVSLLDGQTHRHFSSIRGAERQTLTCQLIISGNYTDNVVPIRVHVREKYGRYAEDRTIVLRLDQQLATSTNVVLEGVGSPRETEAITIGALTSAVDRDIPVNSGRNDNTFVVIIANENYRNVAAVPFALNDGQIFYHYCTRTLSIPEKHIHYVPNATLNDIRAQIHWLSNNTQAFANARVIFYYTGHGIPDESSRDSYLLPVDGYGTDVSTGYRIDDLYAALGDMPAAQITIFMDACFSGAQRNGHMLASAKGIALRVKNGAPRGNMVVFSAAQGDETASFYDAEQHGLFTYFLLRKLQETRGNVDLSTLGDYIITQVRRTAMDENSKPQTPCVTPSASVGNDWLTWRLR